MILVAYISVRQLDQRVENFAGNGKLEIFEIKPYSIGLFPNLTGYQITTYDVVSKKLDRDGEGIVPLQASAINLLTQEQMTSFIKERMDSDYRLFPLAGLPIIAVEPAARIP